MTWEREYSRIQKEINNLSKIVNSDINIKGAQIADKKLTDIQNSIDILSGKATTEQQHQKILELQQHYNKALDSKIRKLLTDKWP